MNPEYTESILAEINELRQLLKRVEDEHSFSTINYASITDEEAEIIREFNIEVGIYSFFSIANYDEGSYQNISQEMACDELEKHLKEAYNFNVRFSSLLIEANKVKPEIFARIDRILNLLKNSGLHFIEIEGRIVDKGGYNLVRMDFKQNGRNDIFEFNYFID